MRKTTEGHGSSAPFHNHSSDELNAGIKTSAEDETTSTDSTDNDCLITQTNTSTDLHANCSSPLTTTPAILNGNTHFPVAEMEMQKRILSGSFDTYPMEIGQTWYIIGMEWFKKWKKFVDGNNTNRESVNANDHLKFPGPIDNSEILGQYPNTLKKNLITGKDFFLVPAIVFAKLKNWYGLLPEQTPIERSVIECPDAFDTLIEVEIYPTPIVLCDSWGSQTCFELEFSLADTLETVEKKARAVMGIPEDKELRLWDAVSVEINIQVNLLERWSKDTTLYTVRLRHGKFINVEVQDDDGSWPRQVDK